MGQVWQRRTEIIDAATLPADVVEAIGRAGAWRRIDWDPRTAHLAWATVSTTEVRRLRTRTRTVTIVGALGDEILAWTVSEDGAPPAAIVVRRDRVDMADGQTALAGLSPELLARAGPHDTDGVTVRGDLGGRDLASAFIALGTGPAADHVKAALLG